MEAKIYKTWSICAGHQLVGHTGQCANLHGHNYDITVWVKGTTIETPQATDEGMVMDYSALSDIVKPVIDAMDHSFLASADNVDDWGSHWPLFVMMARKVCMIGERTTAENIAAWVWAEIFGGVSKMANVDLMGVRISETGKTLAEYIRGL